VVAGLIRRIHDAKRTGARSVEIWGSGRQRREFIYIDDLAGACVFAMRHYTGRGPLNLGGGRDTSIAELAEAVTQVVGYQGTLRFDTSKPDGMPLKSLDGSELAGLGWRPAIPFLDALGRTYEWFLSHEIAAVAQS
jgi:GDP-L-fucose synthase